MKPACVEGFLMCYITRVLDPQVYDVIQASFLAQLRRTLRAEAVLVLVQVEQVCPGYWLDLSELAEQFATDRATLNRSLRKLEKLNLLRRASFSNGGTWIWWVARQFGDVPRPEDEPAWVIKHVQRREFYRIPLTDRWSWCDARKIPRKTFKGFLAGDQMVMRKKWQLVSTPFDSTNTTEEAA